MPDVETVVADPSTVEVVPSAAPIVTVPKSREELAAQKTQAVEDEIFMEAAEVVRDSLKFADIDEDSDKPPRKWLEELDGDADALERRMRVAKASWKGPKDAPMGIHNAKGILTALSKVRAERLGPRQLNVVAIVVNTQGSAYPEEEVE